MTDPVTFTIGITQWFKNLGFQGWYLRFIGVAVGLISAYVSVFYPDAWPVVSKMATPLTATGGVSFLGDMLLKLKRPANG